MLLTKYESMSDDPEQLPFRTLTDGQRDSIHRALLTGLLGSIATKTDKHEFTAARDVKTSIHPGSGLFKNQPLWIMAAELVETTRLYARICARIQPQWIERAGEHLLKRSYSDPHWNDQAHHVNAFEKVTLFGLVIVARRGVNYGPIEPKVARQLFILHGLIDGRFRTAAPFFKKNQALSEEVRELEAKVRRRDLALDAQQLFGFYDARLPPDVFDGPSFEKWFRQAEQHHRHQLLMAISDLLRNDAPSISPSAFPDHTTVAGNRFKLHYQFEPASAADGITVDLPLAALGHLPAGAFDWLVPGWLVEKIVSLIRTLPRGVRTKLVPAPTVAANLAKELRFGEGDFLATVADRCGNIVGEIIPPSTFKQNELAPFLKMNIRVIDEGGRTLAASRDLAELREKLADVTRDAFKDLPASPWAKKNVTRWDFGDLPDSIAVRKPGITVLAYPTLVENGERVDLRLLDSPESAAREMRTGMRRLFMQQLAPEFKQIARAMRGWSAMALNYASLAPAETLRRSILLAVADEALFHDDPSVVRTQSAFADRAAKAWKKLNAAADAAAAQATLTLQAYHAVAVLLEQRHPAHHHGAIRDVRQQVAALLPPDFAIATPLAWRPHLPRFLRAAEVRLTKLKAWGAEKDSQLASQVRPFWLHYADRIARKPSLKQHPDLINFRWMIEELRVGLFAQELKTSAPVSVQRLEKQWQSITSRSE